jgi:hypothetical protein
MCNMLGKKINSMTNITLLEKILKEKIKYVFFVFIFKFLYSNLLEFHDNSSTHVYMSKIHISFLKNTYPWIS